MSVPILDDAYMQRRYQAQRWARQAEYWRLYAGGKAANYAARRDPIEEAKEQYVEGEIGVAALESRVEYALRSRPQGLTG